MNSNFQSSLCVCLCVWEILQQSESHKKVSMLPQSSSNFHITSSPVHLELFSCSLVALWKFTNEQWVLMKSESTPPKNISNDWEAQHANWLIGCNFIPGQLKSSISVSCIKNSQVFWKNSKDEQLTLETITFFVRSLPLWDSHMTWLSKLKLKLYKGLCREHRVFLRLYT